MDDGSLLREGPAVLQYLADLQPASLLAPAQGSLERYRLLEWLAFLNSEIHKGFIPLLYAVAAGKYGVETAKPKLEQRYAWVNAQLAGKRYLMGDGFTVADAYLFALTQWGRRRGWSRSTRRAFTLMAWSILPAGMRGCGSGLPCAGRCRPKVCDRAGGRHACGHHALCCVMASSPRLAALRVPNANRLT